MSVANIAVRGQVEVCDPDMVRGHVDVHEVLSHKARCKSLVRVPAKGHDGVHGSCCNWSPCECPHFVFQLEAMVMMSVVMLSLEATLMFIVRATVMRPCSRIWSLLLPEAVLLSMVQATTEGRVDVSGVS